MAASNESLAHFKKRQKYCCDPFKEHTSKRTKDLRHVTDIQARDYPSLVSVGEKICTNCRKRLGKLPPEAAIQPSDDEQNEEQGIDDSFTHDQSFTSPEVELSSLNTSLELIGATPFKKYRAHNEGSYVVKKKQKIQNALSQKIDAVYGASIQQEMEGESPSYDESHSMQKILTSLIQKYHSTPSRSQKITILTIFAKEWSRRKIMEEFGCSQRMATQAKHLAIEKGILSTPNPKVGKGLDPDTAASVRNFYYNEDISRMMPGKKDCVTILENGERKRIQKRLVLGNLNEIYQQFKAANPEKKVGFSKFAMLRPKECVLAGSSGTHSVCVCTIHNNVKLMMAGSKMETVTANEDVPLKHYSHALAMTMCNPTLPSCHLGTCECCPGKEPLKEILERCYEEMGIDELQFSQWTSTDRSSLETMVKPIEDFLDLFVEKLETLKQHDFIAKQQGRYLNDVKENLLPGEFLVIGDFSENYSFVVQDEAQSFHWNNSMATLHPFFYYYRESGDIKHGNFVLVSDCNTHDTVAVYLFQKHLINHLKGNFQCVQKVIYFSDGCGGQYKNLKNFINLCFHQKDFGVLAEWHFFATSHGKGPSDGIGGTIKREATKASLQRPYREQILTPLKLFEFIRSNLHGINAKFVTGDDWNMEEEFLFARFLLAKTKLGLENCIVLYLLTHRRWRLEGTVAVKSRGL